MTSTTPRRKVGKTAGLAASLKHPPSPSIGHSDPMIYLIGFYIPSDYASTATLQKHQKLTTCKKEAHGYHLATMPTLVIKSFPQDLHSRLKKIASTHRRSVTQETIKLLEKALEQEESAIASPHGVSKWATRTILPEYAAMEKSGAFRNGTDSTVSLSEEREGK